MQIDDYKAAIDFVNRLKSKLPFRVRPSDPLLQAMEKESAVSATTWLEVDTVAYSGDAGGIMVNIVPNDHNPIQQTYSTSLTQVVFDPDHELAVEVQTYQK